MRKADWLTWLAAATIIGFGVAFVVLCEGFGVR